MKSIEKNIRHHMNSGFTLVELLLVVAILGVLAAVAVNMFGNPTQDAKITATRTVIGNIEKAMEIYQIRNSKFPDSLEVLTTMDPPLLKKHALVDSFGTPFQYKKTTNYIEIRSAGPDGQMSTEDDIWNAD